MVTSSTEKGVIVIGGRSQSLRISDKISDALLELSGDSVESLEWKTLDQKLIYPRSDHVSFIIPDTCNPY